MAGKRWKEGKYDDRQEGLFLATRLIGADRDCWHIECTVFLPNLKIFINTVNILILHHNTRITTIIPAPHS
jgi:hypothetical protein